MQSLAARQQYFQETSHRFVHYWSNYVQTHQHEFNHLEREIENILAALGIVKSTDTSYPKLVLGIYDYFEFRGFLDLAQTQLQKLLKNNQVQNNTDRAAALLN